MAFGSRVGEPVIIRGVTYTVAEHPAARGMPYGQRGRAGTVYQLRASDGRPFALKVFSPRFREPYLVTLAEQIAPYATFPGLQVCQREVLTPQQDKELLRTQPDLLYAVLMPWIPGKTWLEVLLERSTLDKQRSLALAHVLLRILVVMEQYGIAHCDLSASNLLLPDLSAGLNGHTKMALVDVEQFYSSDLRRPEHLTTGTPGYAHRTISQGIWASNADRFAGAILLAEILGSCDRTVCEAVFDESYFDPRETQETTSERFQILLRAIETHWGDAVARLLEQAWFSKTLSECPTFGEWQLTLPDPAPKSVQSGFGIRPVPAPVLGTNIRLGLRLLNGEVYRLTKAATTIGRGSDCDIVLRDTRVSRLHAIVHVDSLEKVHLEDKGSSNGTFLHGKQLNPHQLYPLQVGDLFRLNLNVLELTMEQTPAAQTRNLSADSGSPVGPELLLSTLVSTNLRAQDPLAKPYERLMLLIANQKWDEAHYQVQAMLAYDASYRDIQLLSQRIAQRRILKRQQ